MDDCYPIPDEFRHRPWLEVRDAAFGKASAVPTMLRPDEQRLYYWLTRHEIGGPGAVVDLGSFVGGSTARLAKGLNDAGSVAPVHAYDRFTVDDKTKHSHLYARGIAEFDGNDMMPLSQQLLKPWRNRLHLHRGDIMETGWDASGGKIALLILDASKTPELTDHIAERFYPHLVAGRSIINQQDFLMWNQFWLPAHMLMLADFFQPLAHVGDTSLMYRCIRPPSIDELRQRRVTGLSADRLTEAVVETKQRYRGWGMGKRLSRMIDALVLNPDERRHWRMIAPPRRD